jgi:dTMP kinase
MAEPISSGVLIAFEGIDGSGKSTQASMLGDWARGLGFEVVATKEPTSGTWGARIRESMFTRRLSPDEELKCFVNDRREHVDSLILPALKRGALVIIDRYYYSTVAYQGARGLDPGAVLALNRDFAPIPDLVFLIDVEPKTGLERVSKRGAGQDLFETLDELTKARQIFQWLAQTEHHLRTVDARVSVEAVHHTVLRELVLGPIFGRMKELSSRMKIPSTQPAYALLRLAQQLAEDSSIPVQEKARRLWQASRKS